jgi:hypothetical protein
LISYPRAGLDAGEEKNPCCCFKSNQILEDIKKKGRSSKKLRRMTVGRKKRLKTFHPLTHIKLKW